MFLANYLVFRGGWPVTVVVDNAHVVFRIVGSRKRWLRVEDVRSPPWTRIE